MMTKEEIIKELKKLSNADVKKTLSGLTGLEGINKQLESLSSMISSFNKFFPIMSEIYKDADERRND